MRNVCFFGAILYVIQYSMGSHCIGIKEQRDGIDFYFASKSASQTFLSFLYSIIILDKTQVGSQASKRLISHDHKSNIANYKYTAYAELPPICRWDLVLIPLKVQKKCGGRCPLMLCHKVSTSLHFLDPSTLHTIELDPKQYFRYFFKPISAVGHLSVFYVQSKEPLVCFLAISPFHSKSEYLRSRNTLILPFLKVIWDRFKVRK